jgi:hypothetical protein
MSNASNPDIIRASSPAASTSHMPYARLGGIRSPNGPVRVLVGHHDEATAYRQGATQWWVESRPSLGQRLCRRAPHLKRVMRGGYEGAAILFLDDAGGVRCAYLSRGSTPAQVDAFQRRFAAALKDRTLASAVAHARTAQ